MHNDLIVHARSEILGYAETVLLFNFHGMQRGVFGPILIIKNQNSKTIIVYKFHNRFLENRFLDNHLTSITCFVNS